MTQVLMVIMVSHLFLNLKMHAMREHSSESDEFVVSTNERIFLDPITLDTTLDVHATHE